MSRERLLDKRLMNKNLGDGCIMVDGERLKCPKCGDEYLNWRIGDMGRVVECWYCGGGSTLPPRLATSATKSAEGGV